MREINNRSEKDCTNAASINCNIYRHLKAYKKNGEKEIEKYIPRTPRLHPGLDVRVPRYS